MSGNSYKNARFAEYGSYGPGYVLNSDRPLLTSIQAEGYTLKNVLGDYDAANMVKSMYGVKIAEAENPSETPSEEKPSTEIKVHRQETNLQLQRLFLFLDYQD